MKKARDKYTNLYDFAPIGYLSISLEGRIIDLNPVGADMLGMERSLPIGTLFSDFFSKDKDTQEAFYLYRKKLFEKRTRQVCELKLIRPNGDQLDVQLQSVVTEDDEGAPQAFLVAVIDITERKKMEDVLRKNEKKYRELYLSRRTMADNVPDLIWAKDMEHRYLFANSATCRILLNAVDTNEPMGKTHGYFAQRERKAHPENPYWYDFAEQCIDSDAIVMRTGEPQRFEEHGHVKGKYICLDVYKAPFLDDQDNQIGIVGCGRDVTKEKTLEKELHRLNDELEQRVKDRTAELSVAYERLFHSQRLAAIGALAGTVAHEINSPLQAVTVLLKILRDRRNDDVELLKSIDILAGAFESIRDTVKNLNDLSRPAKEAKQQTNVNVLLERTSALTQSNLAMHKIRTHLELSRNVPDIMASPQQLSQLFLNLINNAKEAMACESSDGSGVEESKTGGKMSLRTMVNKEHVVIMVADSGPGIPEEDLCRVFEATYTREKRIGMGLGLFICHNIVENHRGTIAVNNRVEGGSVFTIKLPL